MRKPSELNRMVNPAMDDIVLKAVAYNKNRRYATCLEFGEDLEKYINRYL
jgi:hypothetical protein